MLRKLRKFSDWRAYAKHPKHHKLPKPYKRWGCWGSLELQSSKRPNLSKHPKPTQPPKQMSYKMYSFEKLHVWTDIRHLIKTVYMITSTFPENEKFGLVSQMRRSSISISSNLAEGSSRTSSKDQAHFYQMAYSSMMELLSQGIVCSDLNYITDEIYDDLRNEIQTISFKLNALRKSTLNPQSTSTP